jgi:hypothetical protein
MIEQLILILIGLAAGYYAVSHFMVSGQAV